MAARTRRSKVQPPEIATMKVVYRGANQELNGQSFVVPASIKNKARFIEQQVAKKREEEEAAAAALAEAQATPEPVEAPVAAEPVVAPVEAPAAPSGNEALALAASLANVQSALLVQSREAELRQAEVAALLEQVQALMTQLESEAVGKAEAVKIVRNQQDFMNGMQQSISERIRLTQAENNDLVVASQAARAVLDEYSVRAKDALEVTEEIDNLIDRKFEEKREQDEQARLAAFNASLRAAGVSRSQFLQALNSGITHGEQAVIATTEEMRRYVGLQQKFAATLEDQKQRINEQARSAAELIGGA